MYSTVELVYSTVYLAVERGSDGEEVYGSRVSVERVGMNLFDEANFLAWSAF